MPKTIAIVEDDIAIRDNYTAVLTGQGLYRSGLRRPSLSQSGVQSVTAGPGHY